MRSPVSDMFAALCALLPLGLWLAGTGPAGAASDLPTAEALLESMDRNLVFETRTATMTMTVESGGRTRSYTMRSLGRGEDDSAIEYLSPPRDKGTRMLKLGGELWIYLPSIDRTQKISGHMLREGMMGSDVSYEDLMTSSALRQRYAAKVTGEDAVEGRRCYQIEMTAKDAAVTYPRRLTWVDAETFIPLKQELFALSGKLLKVWTMGEIREFPGNRRFPTRMEVRDALRKGSRTEIRFTDLVFGVDLEKEVFSMRWLERK